MSPERRQKTSSSQRLHATLYTVALVVFIVAATLFSVYVVRQLMAPAVTVTTAVPPTPPPPPPPPPPPLPSEPVSIADAWVKGSPDARIAIIEFAEFQCPWCARFCEATLPELTAQYIDTGKVRHVYWHYPIESIHADALKAAEAAECAGEQGMFWEMHDRLCDDPRQLDEPSLNRRAEAAGLDMGAFAKCLDGAMTGKVRRQAAAAGKPSGASAEAGRATRRAGPEGPAYR